MFGRDTGMALRTWYLYYVARIQACNHCHVLCSQPLSCCTTAETSLPSMTEYLLF